MPVNAPIEKATRRTVKRYRLLTPKHQAVIRAVGELYRSQPSVVRFTMRRGKSGGFRRGGYTWYREPWMNDMLNAYRLLIGKRA